MFAPSLKLIASTVQRLCVIKNEFLGNARSGPFSQIHSHIKPLSISRVFRAYSGSPHIMLGCVHERKHGGRVDRRGQ